LKLFVEIQDLTTGGGEERGKVRGGREGRKSRGGCETFATRVL
jgi:hypothetical protein